MSKEKSTEKEKNVKQANPRQQDVLDYSFSNEKKNLLVSAAAGSGKTKILVDKIIDMVSNPENKDKTSLDKMLIMTFTLKATYEMKSRIKAAIEKKLIVDPTSEVLIRESATIQNANITTIDAFCKRMVEEYYTELNEKEKSLYKEFDPSYRIADEKELSILYNNVLDEFLENEVYIKDEKGQYIYDEFLQAFFKKNSDKIIREMLLNGIKFLSSLAWPVDKLDEWINVNPTTSSDSNIEISKTNVEKLNGDLKNAIEAIKQIDGFDDLVAVMKNAFESEKNKKKDNYEKCVQVKSKGDEELEKKLKEYESSETRCKKYERILDNNLALYKELSKSDFDVEEFITTFVNNKFKAEGILLTDISDIRLAKTAGENTAINNNYKEALAKINAVEKLFELKDSIIQENASIKFGENAIEKTYIKLLKEFYIRVTKEKVKKNIYAISDYANLTLDILYDDEHDKVSKFATNNLKNKYEYIFVDEYQDTNDIQEKIISAISSGTNVFMVGDVKQSIYAFRNANPQLFVDKFDLYNDSNSKEGKLITMDINYRSSYKIIGFVNELFKECMTKDFGKIDYEANGMLVTPTKDNNSGLSDEEIKKRKNGKKVELYILCDKKKYDAAKKDDKTKKGDKTKKDDDVEVNDDTKGVKSLVAKMEAEFVAQKIVELHDKEGMKYNDIVVLMRNPSTKVDFYMDALSKYNIPCYLQMKKGFFNRIEIRSMVDILNIIDNDRQDIPLANVLTSDIIGITNQELAFIKYAHIKTTSNRHARLVDDVDYFYNYMKYIKDDKYAETIKKENKEKKESLDEETKKYIKKNKGKDEFDEAKYTDKRKELSKDIDDREPNIIEQVKKFRDVCSENFKDDDGKDVIDFELLSKKLTDYRNIFNKLRMKSRYLGISALINEVYSLTNIKNIMASMNDGIMRNANLDSLYEFAKDYEATSFVGLFNFMRYIEKIKKLDDKGLAKTSDENDDVVRIMSIHASKGLEFKCVILTGCGSNYNLRDLYRSVPVQFDSELGIAMDGYDLENKYCIETEKKIKIKNKKEKAIKEEEMRVLYVALTRPKERLIIVGGAHNTGQGAISYTKANKFYSDIISKQKPSDDKENESGKESTKEETASNEKAEKDIDCNSYLQLILNNYNPKTVNCKIERVLIDIDKADSRVEDKLTLENIVSEEDKDLKAEKKLLSGNKNDISIFEKLDSEHLDKNLKFTYGYSDYQNIDKAKMSVSDIKKEKHDIELFEKLRLSDVSNSKLYDNDEGSDDDKEKNAESEGISEKLSSKEEKKFSTERGNAYHRYMQFYDYAKNEFTGEIGNGVVGNKPWIDIVKPDKIKAFLNTNLGKEMAEAFKKEELYREHKFMKLFSVDDINEYRTKIENTPITINEDLSKEHNIIIQGIIDAFYIKKDGNDEYAVLVDYKTDGLSSKNINEKELEEELKNEYKIQLDIYADVLKELTGLKVKHKYIYSFALDKAIDLEEK